MSGFAQLRLQLYEPSTSEHAIGPLKYIGNPDEAFARSVAIIERIPRFKIKSLTDRYLHAECQSALFRFVDDVEFLLDDQRNVIHVRSASRIGQSDLGVNKKRIEWIRCEFEEAERPQDKK